MEIIGVSIHQFARLNACDPAEGLGRHSHGFPKAAAYFVDSLGWWPPATFVQPYLIGKGVDSFVFRDFGLGRGSRHWLSPETWRSWGDCDGRLC